MTEFILGESFYQIFEDKLKVEKKNVLDTYNFPTRIESIDNDITLFLKKYLNGKLSHLLLATQRVNNEEVFSFAYWIPDKFVNNEVSLISILEIFANNFGCKIKISGYEGYFIKKSRKLIHGKLESLNQLMEILGSEHIPCESYLFYKENIEYNLNWIDCFYSFAINNNKYLTWLYSIETVSIKVKSEWHTYLSDIRDILNPNGNTSLTIMSNYKNKDKGLQSYKDIKDSVIKEIEIEIPKSYLKPFTRINNLISQFDINDKIVVIPKFENNKCVFCGSTDTNKEHIFAKWMKDYFDEKTFRSTLHVRIPEENLLKTLQSGVSKGAESSYGYTTQYVCIKCNGTWMSQLEETVKSILAVDSTTLKNTINELKLDYNSSQKLAIWITVKSILLSVKASIIPVLPINTLNDLKAGNIPDGFLVEIAECDSSDLNFIINKGGYALGSRFRLKKMDLKVANEIAEDFFIVSIQMGNFLFRISYLNEIKGLKREGCIKQTEILFPFKFDLPYFKIENEQDTWYKIENKLKIHIFNLGLSLIDY